MAAAIATQNQNFQLTKTFIVAFGAVLLAIPITAVITTAIIQAQLGSFVHAQSAPQTNSLAADNGYYCEMPADEKQAVLDAQKNTRSGSFFGRALVWVPGVSQSNHNSTTTTTTTKTTTIDNRNSGNTNIDNRWSGNTHKFTDNRWSGNTLGLSLNSGNTTTNTSVNIKDNGNTNNQTWNQNNNSVNNSGNTTNTDNSQTNLTTNVNSGNTVINDNDGIDIL